MYRGKKTFWHPSPHTKCIRSNSVVHVCPLGKICSLLFIGPIDWQLFFFLQYSLRLSPYQIAYVRNTVFVQTQSPSFSLPFDSDQTRSTAMSCAQAAPVKCPPYACFVTKKNVMRSMKFFCGKIHFFTSKESFIQVTFTALDIKKTGP